MPVGTISTVVTTVSPDNEWALRTALRHQSQIADALDNRVVRIVKHEVVNLVGLHSYAVKVWFCKR